MTRLIVLFAALMALSAPTAAQDADAPLATDASHVVIMDYETGLILFEKNGYEAMPPASMSKIMTMLMVFERLEDGSITLEDEFTVSERAWREGGLGSGSSAMCLEPNERVSVEDLIRGVIVLSGNDASIVLAEGLEGSEGAFADEMTRRAEELGLTSATFANATGWPHPDHRISARDLAEITRITIRDHPTRYPYYAEREFGFCTEAPSNRFNRNPALLIGADGLKTGHTEESGYGLVASEERDGVRRIVVFNGMGSNAERSREAERLLNAAFRDFRVHTLFGPGDEVGEVPVFLGAADSVAVVAQEELTVGYHRRAARDAVVAMEYDGPLRAPIAAGDVIGRVVVETPGAPPVSTPLIAAQDVARLGLVGRASRGLLHFIRTAGG